MTAGLSFVDKDTFPARQFTSRRPRARRPRRIFRARRRLRRPRRRLHAAHVHQRRRLRRRRHHGRLPRPGRLLRPDRQARAPERRRPDRRSPRTHQRRPVIIEDDVLVGGNCGVYEGTLVRSGAVLGAGTILTRVALRSSTSSAAQVLPRHSDDAARSSQKTR